MKIKTEKTLPKILPGSVHQQFKRCGKQNCKCARGELHGAYHYHFVRIDGKLKKRYLKAKDVDKTQRACTARQLNEKEQRERLSKDWQRLRELRAEIREFSKKVKNQKKVKNDDT